MKKFSFDTTIFLIFSLCAIAFLVYWAGAIMGGRSTPSGPAVTSQGVETPPPLSLSQEGVSGKGSGRNLTYDIVNDVSREFLATLGSGDVSEKNAQSLIDNNAQLKEFVSGSSFSFATEPLHPDRIRVDSGASSRANKDYLDEVASTIYPLASVMSGEEVQKAIEDVFQRGSFIGVNRLREQSTAAAVSLYGARVPSSLRALHERTITLFENMSRFYGLVVSYQDDPVSLLAAIERFPVLMEEGRVIASMFNAISG